MPIKAKGPGAALFTGYFDQTSIFFKMAQILSSETTLVDQLLKTKDHIDAISKND